MRLLKHDEAGRLSFTEDLPNDKIPPYAILSHRWGPPGDEVGFEDVKNRTAANKRGYDKISFCTQQALRDGLRYFWVDTCCIDKSNSTELSEAINSMFRWYANADKCYVYLTDVSRRLPESANEDSRDSWVHDFRKSTWFTRGWTLQELLAPKSVEFFSNTGEKLGSKVSLERHISDVTGIPVRALRGDPLATFTIIERFSWQETRSTTKEEDRYYSLLGIMDVSMSIIYGEGKDKARRRLEKEISDASKGRSASRHDGIKCGWPTPALLMEWTGIQSEDFSVTFSLVDVVEVGKFVARGAQLSKMRETLLGDGSRRTIVLHGLGGIGKTQLALAYAVQYRDSYSAVFWLNIKDEDALKSSFVKVAKQILRDHPSASRLSDIDLKGDINVVVDAVKAWLSIPNNTHWLLIYDNYDNPKLPGNTDTMARVDIRSYLPEARQGSVIITTRSSEVNIGHRLPLQKFDDLQDSIDVLAYSSERQDLFQDPGAKQLAQKLDGLPLALATAGAYLHQTPISCTDYLRYYEESWAKLQKTSPGLMSYEDRTLYSTWEISFGQIEQKSPVAANLLRLWAYFDNQDLWDTLLRYTRKDSPDWFQELVTDELTFIDHVRVLCNHGLVEKYVAVEAGLELQGYGIHPCVHSWTKTVLNPEWDWQLGKIALCCIASNVPDNASPNWGTISRRLLNHAANCIRATKEHWHPDDDVDWAFFNLGILFAEQERLYEAEQMYERALRGREKTLGLEHTSTLNTVHNLGTLYYDQGKLDLAEQMYRRALLGKEKTLGQEHISTLQTVNDLGIIYSKQGKLDLAEQMYRRALQGKEKTLGQEHISTLQTVDGLGVLYSYQGKFDLAEQMCERALREQEKTLGQEHTSTLNTVNNLGALYYDQGKLDLAEQMYNRALRGLEKILGLDHTWTLLTARGLGLVYCDQGKLDLAEQMYNRALRGLEKILGLDHISTLDTISNLGFLYIKQGKLDLAEQMWERALLGYVNLSHPPQNLVNDLEKELSSIKANHHKPSIHMHRGT